jgi:hypothetical protein
MFAPFALVIGLLSIASSAQAAECTPSCGATNTSCAPNARDRLLNVFGCLSSPSASFVYNGGLTRVNHPTSACWANLETPAEDQIFVSCRDLKIEYDNIITQCFVRASNGAGKEEIPFRSWGIDTCGKESLPSQKRWEGGVDGVQRGQSMDGEILPEDMDEETEIAQLISYLLRENVDTTIFDGDAVFTFPYSSAPEMTLRELAERSAELKQKCGL